LSFVIFTALVLMLDSCIGKRITKANVDKVTEGMSKKKWNRFWVSLLRRKLRARRL